MLETTTMTMTAYHMFGAVAYEPVCLRVEQIRLTLSQLKKCRFYETLGFGVFGGAENDGTTHFAPRAFVGSRRRHDENTFSGITVLWTMLELRE